jgi:hypothetical protein
MACNPKTSYQALTENHTPTPGGLPDRLKQMNGLFSNKKLGVWDAMTLAADQKQKQEDQEKKMKIKR